ncbi:NEQ509 [Nanoarchaeum equitans Kin4-M]|uniref:DNA ligase n=1 Tax=Nanoarchaeum equitans (strain Kin4-M) TaxID=228908 RepID=DNLI_NANEQ|nr:RecName: Full=DNA ligase; AltName: Full=Polydeoxyribonucleotide synthase [ATP] [Nanoarchaeum equitans Kin4-M]AAR39350.1 NEQ509 [Nanoarchaeum equitans Kin4-M]
MEFEKLANLFSKLETISDKTRKVQYIARFLKELKDQYKETLLLLQGTVFYPWEQKNLGIAEKGVIRAISIAYGIEKQKVEELFIKYGDLGIVAEKACEMRKQKPLLLKPLTVKDVYQTLRKIADIEGEGSQDKKIITFAKLLVNAKPKEAKYIVRLALEELRIGVGEGIIRDAIAIAFSVTPEAVEYAYSILLDFGEVVRIAKEQGEQGLWQVKLQVGRPFRVMLAIRARNVQEAFDIVGRPAMIEAKYDGFRLQIHKKGDQVWLWTRRLEDVTRQFPDVVNIVRNRVKANEIIFEAEAVGYDKKTNKFLPFQKISQRVKRKYDIEKMAKEIPVELHAFDIVYLEGEQLMKKPFKERRALLEKVIDEKEHEIQLSIGIIEKDDKKAYQFYQDCLNKGLEGVMFKNLNAPYQPGRRVGYMVKLKPTLETLDLVIVAAEWGEGKRSGWLTSFTVAALDKDTGNYLEVGEVGTGIKEKKERAEDITFEELTELLKPYIYKQEGKKVYVKPKIVVEVAYEEIQESPRYKSGFALRFPRIVRIRFDRSPKEIDTIDRIKQIYEMQRGGIHKQ